MDTVGRAGNQVEGEAGDVEGGQEALGGALKVDQDEAGVEAADDQVEEVVAWPDRLCGMPCKPERDQVSTSVSTTHNVRAMAPGGGRIRPWGLGM